jgi:hypothetical protein
MAKISRTSTDSIDLDDEELLSLKTFLAETCSSLALDNLGDLTTLVERIDQWLRTAMPDITEEM